ncbi:hypothetical protein [Nocardioides sp. SYSU DS0651]|uniref:hypothetical protein n=1 Tax=Nocardioides sp. SYSU DS0651 TaxID=3415955 RepID=UPI003F4B72E2
MEASEDVEKDPGESDEQDADGAVTLFLDGEGSLYVRGDAAAVDVVLREILGPDQLARRRSATSITDAAAIAGSAQAMTGAAEEFLRLDANGLAKVAQFGEQTKNGALRGYVRDGNKFAGDLTFEKVTFQPEQALAMQQAAVSLALRSAIADVKATVEQVGEEVSDIARHTRAREIGDVVGTFRYLQQVVEATRQRGHLLNADWDEVAGAKRDLLRALESLRAYALETVNALDPDAVLPKRAAATARAGSPKGVAGTLRLILVAEQALHLQEYLRLERVRITDPDHLESALADARGLLRSQRELDEQLVETATARLDAARRIDPLEIHRVFSIPEMQRASTRALEAVEAFAGSARVELPTLEKELQRPQLAEARAELGQRATAVRTEVADVSRVLGKATSTRAKNVAGRFRRTPGDSDEALQCWDQGELPSPDSSTEPYSERE